MHKISAIIFVLTLLIVGTASANFPENPSIRTFQLTYSLSDSLGIDDASKSFDYLLNPNSVYRPIAEAADSTTKFGVYGLKTIRSSDFQLIEDWNDDNPCYDKDSLFLYNTSEDTIVIRAIAPSASPCTDFYATVTTLPGDSLQTCTWSSLRYPPDWGYEGYWSYHWYYCKEKMGDDYDLFLCDEDAPVGIYKSDWYCANNPYFPFDIRGTNKWVQGHPSDVQGYSGMSSTVIVDSIKSLKSYYLPMIDSTFDTNGKEYIGNPVTYGLMSSDVFYIDMVEAGLSLLLGEQAFTRPLDPRSRKQTNNIEDMVDSCIALDNGSRCWLLVGLTTPDTTTLGLDRAYTEILTWYYTIGSKDHTVLGVYDGDNDYPYSKRTMRRQDINFVDIGDPDGERYVTKSGTDGVGQSYTIYQRNYTHIDGSDTTKYIVLHREKSGSNYSSSSGVTVNLVGGMGICGSCFEIIHADTSKTVLAQSQVNIKNCEGFLIRDKR